MDLSQILDFHVRFKRINTVEVPALCVQMNEPVNNIRNSYALLVIISAEGYKKRHVERWESHR